MTDNTKGDTMQDLENKIESAIAEAEEYATQHGLDFHISPAYGMGGFFDGKEAQWYPSSQGC